ncbi:DUF2577 family protein [Longirhabdus pacifica]|uniref:DUF2577 family protein n=1 Tax=Longirhabdus pacifica TaxID=2305227 RepID=UPI001008F904|nr:DUF2577 family protein [Longirhabdus pacifica]
MKKLNGGPLNQWIQLFKFLGYNADIGFELATVASINPFKMKLNRMEMELDGSDIIISDHLVDHKRYIEMNDQLLKFIEGEIYTKDVNGHDISATGNFVGSYDNPNPPPPKIPVEGDMNLSTNLFTFTSMTLNSAVSNAKDNDGNVIPMEVKILSPLAVNDTVIVAVIHDQQHYIILDKAVIL